MDDVVEKLNDNVRMQQQKSDTGEINFNVEAGSADVGVFSRKSSGQFDDNNKVRQILVNSLKVQFGVDDVLALPDSVKNALKIGSWRDDFKFDHDGNVTSGRPLTARRIKAVIMAVKTELDANKGVEKAWNILKSQAEIEHKQPKKDVFDYFVDKVSTIPVHTLNVFEDGVDDEVFSVFGKNISDFENSLFVKMPERIIDAVDGGDGEIWRNVISSIIVGRMPTETRNNLLKYVNSDSCLTCMRNYYARIADPEISDDEFQQIKGQVAYMSMIRLAVCDFFDMTAKDI